jgi:hypothetical protein
LPVPVEPLLPEELPVPLDPVPPLPVGPLPEPVPEPLLPPDELPFEPPLLDPLEEEPVELPFPTAVPAPELPPDPLLPVDDPPLVAPEFVPLEEEPLLPLPPLDALDPPEPEDNPPFDPLVLDPVVLDPVVLDPLEEVPVELPPVPAATPAPLLPPVKAPVDPFGLTNEFVVVVVRCLGARLPAMHPNPLACWTKVASFGWRLCSFKLTRLPAIRMGTPIATAPCRLADRPMPVPQAAELVTIPFNSALLLIATDSSLKL